jgi:hypothetical protein
VNRCAGHVQGDLGEQVDLGRVAHAGIEDQLVDADLLERGDHGPDRLGGAVRARGDHLGRLGAQDPVVVEQVRP